MNSKATLGVIDQMEILPSLVNADDFQKHQQDRLYISMGCINAVYRSSLLHLLLGHT